MTQGIKSLMQIANRYEAIVLDQWGVLHDGSAPYPSAIATLERLKAAGIRLAVLSNSGKRSAPNAERIAKMGFAPDLFDLVMTSGEALWHDIAQDMLPCKSLYPITRAEGDAAAWAEGLDVTLSPNLQDADAVLLMGLPDDANPATYTALLNDAHRRKVPVLCTNPDRASPRAGGKVVASPGALAHAHHGAGGIVRFYGKPHRLVFNAVEAALDLSPHRLLMVGDSLEHDIAGGHEAGWTTLFIRGGLHASAFAQNPDMITVIENLAAADAAPMPTFTLQHLE